MSDRAYSQTGNLVAMIQKIVAEEIQKALEQNKSAARRREPKTPKARGRLIPRKAGKRQNRASNLPHIRDCDHAVEIWRKEIKRQGLTSVGLGSDKHGRMVFGLAESPSSRFRFGKVDWQLLDGCDCFQCRDTRNEIEQEKQAA